MVSVLNKRQQARNERALQDLIRSVPGNDRCADCAAKNPGWASWSLGIFLCMRCAALHRKLGTHISKVKSLSMDTWNNDQVENMRRIGNTESNRKFNPTNVKPAMPIDVDEVDGVMERFIRQKYEQRIFQSPNPRPNVRNNTGSTSSDERPGPPLPPKPTKRFNFGLRTTSSTFPSSKSDERSPPVSPGLGGFGREPSPPRVNKPSRVFGSTVGSSDMDITSKLSSLREMGFPDDKRNAQILRGHNGNLERTVESLIRLGEKSHTPVASNPASTNGITIEKARPPPPAKSATNPFDMLDAVQPPSQLQQRPSVPTPIPNHGLATSSAAATPTTSYNPFLQSSNSQPLEQSFQSLSVSSPPQQLFPNTTGGYGTQSSQPHFATNPYQHSFTPPPLPQMPPQYASFNSSSQSQAPSFGQFQPQLQQLQQQQQQQPLQAQPTGSNPFLRSSRSQIFAPTNPFGVRNISPSPSPFGPQASADLPFQQRQTASPFGPLPGQTVPQQQQPQPQPQHLQQGTPQQRSSPFAPLPSAYGQQPQSESGMSTPQPQQQPFQHPNSSPFAPLPGTYQQQQQQQQQPAQPSPPQHQHQQQSYNPFNPTEPHQAFQQNQAVQFHQQHQQQPEQPHPFQHQQLPPRFDTKSILALYGQQPRLSPTPNADPSSSSPATAAAASASGAHAGIHSSPRRSVTMPVMSSAGAAPAAGGVPGGVTPQQMGQQFAPPQMQMQAQQQTQAQAQAQAQQTQNGGRHVSQESVDFAGLMGGRHSPDAFAGLSARFVR